MKCFRLMLLMLTASLFFSCLSLEAELEVFSPESYRLTLDYSLQEEFSNLVYLGSSERVVLLPQTAEEYRLFAASHDGVVFDENSFSRSEAAGGRIEVSARLTMDNTDALEDLLSCRVQREEGDSTILTISYDRGGEPSEEAVTYINGYCAGETVSFIMTGPTNGQASGEWALRELLLTPEAPSVTLEWTE